MYAKHQCDGSLATVSCDRYLSSPGADPERCSGGGGECRASDESPPQTKNFFRLHIAVCDF